MIAVTVDEKLAKDRRVLKDIDTRLTLSTRWMVAVILSILALSLSLGAIHAGKTVLVLLSAIGGVLAIPLLYICFRFETYYGAGPARWRRWFKMLSLAMHAWMGVTIAILWINEPNGDLRWLMPITAAILLIYESDDWSPYFEHHGLQIGATWLPLMACLSIQEDWRVLLDVCVVAAFCAVLLLRTYRAFKWFWHNQEEVQRHRFRASELTNEVSSAQNTSRHQADFLSSITREIRTPMNNVLGALALLDDTELSPQQRQLQQVALRSGESLLSMTEDIMDFSKITSGNLVLNKAVFNLRKCFETVMDALGSMAHERKMEITLIITSELPVRVVGDRQRLAQVLHNLVLNAIVYSGGTEVYVEVSADAGNDGLLEITTAVRDNGKGIPTARRDMLFEAFSSKGVDSNEFVSGTGLGLAICNGLVKAMGGAIRVESELSVGTCFKFTARMPVSSQQGQVDMRNKAFMGWRALFVDLSPLLEKSLNFYLRSWDTQVETISGFDRALQLLKNASKEGTPFQMVVVNCPFDNPGGFSFPSWVRDDPKLSGVKVMVLGTLAQKGTLGAPYVGNPSVEWVVKPFTQERLHDALAILSGTRLQENSHQMQRVQRKSTAAENETDSDDNKRMILLVEDNKVNQLVAKGMLQKMGYMVIAVANGREAVGILQERRFDGVLMDCIMPEMDGYEATRIVRSIELSKGIHTPIIAMTANVGETEKRRCLDAGMDDYLSKPVTLDELSDKLKHWLVREEENRSNSAAVVNMTRRSA